MQAKAAVAGPPDLPSHTPAQLRILEAALALFTEHDISGTSLKMIADAIGLTKAAVYHQYNTKDEIVLAIAELVIRDLEVALTDAEAAPKRKRPIRSTRRVRDV
jgi:AcrR family transcriptional regulator